MDNIDLISCNLYGICINLANPRTSAAETSQKHYLHLGKATKAGDCEDFMKAT